MQKKGAVLLEEIALGFLSTMSEPVPQHSVCHYLVLGILEAKPFFFC